MDTLAHGLWGGAAFGQREGRWGKAFWLGMAPDLLSFGPFFLTRLGDIGERWSRGQHGPPDPSIIPAYVYHAYNITHSLVIWSIIVALGWAVTRHEGRITSRPSSLISRPCLLPLGAWALHILCDIPTHSTRFFPTPYLWPFPTPFYDGIPWSNKMFMISNYTAIAAAYLALRLWKVKHRPPSA